MTLYHTAFSPKITLPTRICDSSSTLIDNIFSNNIEEADISGILLNHISDHQMMFTIVENRSYVTDVHKFIDIECNDQRSMRAFLRELEDINIYDKLEQLNDSNPQNNYDRFITLINDAKEKHLPKKTVKFNKRKHKKSKWMTYGILKSINTKDKLYKKIVKADIHDDIHYSALKAEFSEYKKILRRSINEAKHLYYTRTFALYKNDIKQTWSVIKDTLQKKHHCKTTDKFVVNNHVVTDFDEIANNFNIYFINIGKSLSDQIQSVASSQDYLLQHNKPNMTFNFIPVSEVYIDNVINKLKNKSSCGYDNISNKHIKYAKNVLTKPLTLLINQCLHTGIFPSQLKLSRVKPLFKSGDQSRFSNYRPISLLPSLSKIFERVIFDQLLGYFTNNKLLCMDQFGFRPGHSTELAALRLVDHLITQMDKCRVPTNICCKVIYQKGINMLNTMGIDQILYPGVDLGWWGP